MKRLFLTLLLFCAFLLSAGCGSRPKDAAAASDYAQKSAEEISVSNDGFPISISNLLDRFKSYDFYDTLNLETVNADEIDSLAVSESTLYIVEGAEETPEKTELDISCPVYHYDQLTIIYTGSNEAIVQALSEQLNPE